MTDRKVRCEVDLNLDTGEYALKFWNMSHPGKEVQYDEVKEMLRQVFADTNQQIEDLGPDSDDQVTKSVH